MASGTEGAFPKPEAVTDAEWRMLLACVCGLDRAVFGNGPRVTPAIATATPTLIAENRSKDQPMLIVVQVTIAPALTFFGRNSSTGAANGFFHSFPLEPTFRQVLMPNDQLWMTHLGAVTQAVVFEVVV